MQNCFQNKYSFSQDEWGLHQKVLRLFQGGEHVLEVGPYTGYMSRELTKKGCLVYGVEIDPDASRIARKYCEKVICGDIESDKTLKRLPNNFFDVLLLADVIEHLKNPLLVLQKLSPMLRSEGRVIISVPNIAFLTNRLFHLKGDFTYLDCGIMDKTHLKFYTKKTIIQLVKDAGFRLESIDYVGNLTQLPLFMYVYPILGNKRWVRSLEYTLTRRFPELFAVQFLLVCRKSGNEFC